jgi:hypothetical protein
VRPAIHQPNGKFYENQTDLGSKDIPFYLKQSVEAKTRICSKKP